MMQASLWFSSICPHFSVHDAESFDASMGQDEPINALSLAHLGFFRAAQWINDHEGDWEDLFSQVPQFKDDEIKGRYQLIYWGHPQYPHRLINLAHPPAVLFVRGDIECLKAPSISIVGARHPTELGRLWVERVVPRLVELGITIVSGGARGIDGEAHFQTLKHKGKTVAFLPGCVLKPYPAMHQVLFDKMSAGSGALVSEYIPHTQVRAGNFHRRNRMIAGCCDLVLIVEAALPSGTYMTATRAVAENKDIMVVPGPPLVASYAGSLELLASGAGLARDEKDIILYMKDKKSFEFKPVITYP